MAEQQEAAFANIADGDVEIDAQPQQPMNPDPPDPLIVHQEIITMFPDLDLTQTLAEFGHMSSDGLAGVIIDRMARIPKKAQPVQQNEEDTNSVLSENSLLTDNEEQDELHNKMVTELLDSCKNELDKKNTILDKSLWSDIKNHMLEQFPFVRDEFARQIIEAFNGAVVPVAIGCFLATNNFGDKLQKLAPKLNGQFRPLANKRQKQNQDAKRLRISVAEQVLEKFAIFHEMMETYKQKYTTMQIKKTYIMKWKHTTANTEQQLECLVCFDRFPQTRMTYCSVPLAQQKIAINNSLQFSQQGKDLQCSSKSLDEIICLDDEDIRSNDEDKKLAKVLYEYNATIPDELTLPEGAVVTVVSRHCYDVGWFIAEYEGRCGLFPVNFVRFFEQGQSQTSTTTQPPSLPTNLTKFGASTDAPAIAIREPSNLPAKLSANFKIDKNIDHGQSSEQSRENSTVNLNTHAFCHGCIRGQAQAATTNIPLADGAIGLKCMVQGCNNPILFSDIRTLIQKNTWKRLDDRVKEENLATVENLERCNKCGFAIQMEVEKSENKVFDCLNCHVKYCRVCEHPWDDNHFGISCAELDARMDAQRREKRERKFEQEMNEAVIRYCPKCKIPFMKDNGCNRMACRCGMKQCYICRESDIDYTHFCQHVRDPTVENWKCDQCDKKCLLYQDAEKLDEKALVNIRTRKEAEEKENGLGTSQQADQRKQHYSR